MSAKRFIAPGKVAVLALRAAKHPGVMTILLAIALIGAGCATTSSQTASAPKPHKPQMLTDEVERGGFDLPDEIASVFEFLDFFFPRPTEGSPGISWR